MLSSEEKMQFLMLCTPTDSTICKFQPLEAHLHPVHTDFCAVLDSFQAELLAPGLVIGNRNDCLLGWLVFEIRVLQAS